ncbi:MAG TPA: maleylacetoacetate isomerase [Rhizobiaceae bacterium]|nr:maleylacetoacetate isomerase [Rhizobiaceae bacterium]
MKLYTYFRSSAAYRVRIALNLKGIAYEQAPVHLVKDGGQQKTAAYQAVNPQMLVPTLELDDGTRLTQSLAIIEYLDAVHADPKLIPADPLLAAKVRAVALAIACDTHPLNNTRVLAYLRTTFGRSDEEVSRWYENWTLKGGLEPVEALITDGPFCFGDQPTLADICLIPQVFNARRFKVPIDHLPKILRVEATCQALPAFAAARPEAQPDAE